MIGAQYYIFTHEQQGQPNKRDMPITVGWKEYPNCKCRLHRKFEPLDLEPTTEQGDQIISLRACLTPDMSHII